MITFLLGFTIGTIFGATGLVCVAIMYDKHHPDEQKGGTQMSSASAIFGTKAYVCARYFIRPGKCFKYIDQRGDDVTEHVYEVMALYPYCVLLRDTRNGVRTCPGYNTLSLMLRGSEANE